MHTTNIIDISSYILIDRSVALYVAMPQLFYSCCPMFPQFPDVLTLEDDLPHVRSAAKVE